MYDEPLLSGIPCNNYYESNDTHDIIKKIFGQYLPWKKVKKNIYLKEAVNELNNIIFARYEGLNGKQKELMKKLVDILFTNKDKNDKIISDDDKKKNIAYLLNKECKEGGATEVGGGKRGGGKRGTRRSVTRRSIKRRTRRGGKRRSVRRRTRRVGKRRTRRGGKRRSGRTRRGGFSTPPFIEKSFVGAIQGIKDWHLGGGLNWCSVAKGKCATCPVLLQEYAKHNCPTWGQVPAAKAVTKIPVKKIKTTDNIMHDTFHDDTDPINAAIGHQNCIVHNLECLQKCSNNPHESKECETDCFKHLDTCGKKWEESVSI